MAEVSCKLGKLQSGAKPIQDGPIEEFLRSLGMNDLNDAVRDPNIIERFTDSYDAWIRSSSLNGIRGLGSYGRYMSFAVTHAIEQFLMKHRQRRIRTFRGEYPGTSGLISGYNLDHAYLPDDPITGNDAVIISLPFSGSGNQHPLMSKVLDDCETHGIPVMLDCAFFGICKGIDVDLRGNIDTIAFSLSKCYNIPEHRIGMIYSNAPPAGIELLHKHGYTTRFGAALALRLFDGFGPDYAYNRYANAQRLICHELGGMSPSDTVIFSNGDDVWSMFNRGDGNNRIHIGNLLPMMISATT